MTGGIDPHGAPGQDPGVVQLLDHRQYAVHPWRNGRGVLRHIAEGDGWQLRLADITESGPFSDFSGYLRLFAMVEGAVVLQMPSGEGIECDPVSAVAIFDGGAAPHCSLVRGPAKAFNLIVETDKVLATLERQTIGKLSPQPTIKAGSEPIGEDGAFIAIHVQSGRIECRAERSVAADAGAGGSWIMAHSQDTLLLAAGDGFILRAADGDDKAVVLIARVRPLAKGGH
ncbi:MAG TPA: HutD family protein [Lautropia sp.]|nr:HutD family protein [Lautropia sp.]